MDLIFDRPVGSQRLHQVSDVMTEGLAADRQVEGDRLAVLGRQGAAVERVVHRQVADLARLCRGLRRFFHQIFEPQSTQLGLLQAVDKTRADDLRGDDGAAALLIKQSVRIMVEGNVKHAADDRIGGHVEAYQRVAEFIPGDHLRQSFGRRLQRVELLTQLVQALQGGDIENTVGVTVVDHSGDDKIVEGKSLFDDIVEDPHRLVGGKHVLRVVIKLDLGELAAKKHSYCQGQ